MTRFILIPVIVFFALLQPNILKAEATYSQQLEVVEIPIGNHLVWQTAVEFDVATFIVEKSKDGFSYDEIGNIKGAGFSMVDNSYHFMDVGTFDPKCYYRLKEVAEDGTVSFSTPAFLEKKMVNNVNVLNMGTTDVKTTFKMTVDVFNTADLQCTLTGFSGKVLQSFAKSNATGVVNLEVDLENYLPGIYHFNVVCGKEIETITLRRINDGSADRPQVATTKKNTTGRQ